MERGFWQSPKVAPSFQIRKLKGNESKVLPLLRDTARTGPNLPPSPTPLKAQSFLYDPINQCHLDK